MILDSVLNIGSKIIDKIFPDKTQAEQAKLKLLELQQAGEFKQLDAEIEKERIEQQNTISARNREMEMAKSGERDYTPAVLAVGLTIGFFALLILLMYSDIDADVRAPLEIMLGALGSAFIQVMQYYFGSSSSAKKLTEMIHKRINKDEA